MLRDFDELRRRALATGDESDWQRVSMTAARLGLDIRGQALPEHALIRLPGPDFVQPSSLEHSCFTPDGRFLATASWEQVRLWDFDNRSLLWESPPGRLPEPHFDAHGQLNIVYHQSHTEHSLRRLNDSQQLKTIIEWREARTLLACSPTEPLIAKMQPDGLIQFLDLNGEAVKPDFSGPEGVNKLAFSSSGEHLFGFVGHRFFSLRLKDRQLWHPPAFLHSNTVRHCSHSESESVIVLNGETVWRFDLAKQTRQRLFESFHSNSLTSAALSASGKQLVVASLEVGFQCWDFDEGDWIWGETVVQSPRVCAHPKLDRVLTYEGGGALRLRNIKTGQVLQPGLWQSKTLIDFKFVHNNKWLVAADIDDSIQILDLQQHRVVDRLEGEFYDISEDAEWLLTKSRRGFCFGRRGQPSELIMSRSSALRSCWLAPERVLIVGASRVRSFGLEESSDWRLADQHLQVSQADFSPNGELLVSLDTQNRLRLWQVSDRQLLWDKHDFWGDSVIPWFSGDSTVIWVYTSNYQTGKALRRLDALTGELLSEAALDPNKPFHVFAWNPPADIVACVENDREIKVMDAEVKEIARFKGHECSISALRFSNDGRLLASGNRAGGLIVWSLEKHGL